MACFLVPAAEAVVTTIATKVVDSKEKAQPEEKEAQERSGKIPFSHKLRWLNYLLFGGAILLAFEHIWHGEVVPWFPFLTAAANPEDATVMLHEMATVGVTMAILVTVVWIVMCFVADAITKKAGNRVMEMGGVR